MSTLLPQAAEEFQWQPQPQAAHVINEVWQELLAQSSTLAEFSQRLRSETGTRLVDWIDHLRMQADDTLAEDLIESGFTGKLSEWGQIFSHASGLFPRVIVSNDPRQVLAIKVDRVEEAAAAWPGGCEAAVTGSPASSIRFVTLHEDAENRFALEAWERHGARGFAAEEEPAVAPQLLAQHAAAFAARQRAFDNPAAGFAHAQGLIRAALDDLGVHRTCDLFFFAERDYWCGRNEAAQMQKRRQDALGLGWGNHDHHTYRSSRTCFGDLIETLELLGFRCRERFYAGREAGWGAQVIEQPTAGVVIFADVDLSPEEVADDFAHGALPPRDDYGTVGLWCALHGEAFLQAGMHHLECQFDFDAAREQLAAAGVECMPPFTDFPFLKQCFTVGETWQVDSQRLEPLASAGKITPEQAERFATTGALGSHLEILERNDGYKGFNQTGISDIIQRTDPRG